MSAEPAQRSGIGRILRTIFYALLIAFIVGFVIGTLLRREIERPVRYIGFEATDASGRLARISTLGAVAADPSHIVDTESRVLMARDHEEKI